MPRYYFNLSGLTESTDRRGHDFADDDAAWSEAISSTGDYLRDLDGLAPDRTYLRIEVTADDSRPVATIDVSARRHLP